MSDIMRGYHRMHTMNEESRLRVRDGYAYSPPEETRNVKVSVPQRASVTDKARLLGGFSASALRRSIRIAEEQTASEIRVVTLKTIGYLEPAEYAMNLFNRMHVGKGKPRGGVLVLIVKDRRRIEIQVSSKLNRVVSKAWTQTMLQSKVLPHLRRDDYGVGLRNAVEAVAHRIATCESGDAAESPLLLVGVGGFFLCQKAVDIHADRRSRKCYECGMIIKPGYDYESHRMRVGEWGVVEEATDKKAGVKERTLSCECGAVSTRTAVIPRYDGRRRKRMDDGTYYWEYYYDSDSGDSGSGSDGGGGGGGDF